MGFGLACCAIEMMATNASNYDLDRIGVFPRLPHVSQDVIIISGTVTFKMAERIKRLYEQMPEPRYVISWVLAQIAAVLIGAWLSCRQRRR